MSGEFLILFFLVAVVLVGGAIVFSYYAAPSSTNPVKHDPYECGIPTKGLTWLQFNVGYYLFAIIFLVFDVETVFVFPWSVMMREKSMGMTAFVEIIIFFFVLVLGLMYAWKKKALIWE